MRLISPPTTDDYTKAATPRGLEILAHYRALRKNGVPSAQFCSEAIYDECCAWCVRLIDAEEGLQNADGM